MPKPELIATSQHVIGLGPSSNEITFYDGSIIDSEILYADDIHDFAFLKIDKSKLQTKLVPVKLGSAFTLHQGDPLMMIGNNQVEEYSIKTGKVSNLFVNKGYLYANYIHSSFDRAGGSSGSPVWNEKLEVVGLHTSGNRTASFELYIDYLIDALKQIQAGKRVRRGYLGIDLDLVSFGIASRYHRFPKKLVDKVLKQNEKAEKNKESRARIIRKLPIIVFLIPGSVGAKKLQVGDILWAVNGVPIYDNLYKLDLLLNQNLGKRVEVEVYRHGKRKKFRIPVSDLEKTRINGFIRFSGAVFHRITPFLKRDFGFDESGVYMHYAEPGSSFSTIANRDKKRQTHAVIQMLDGKPIKDMDSLYEVLKTLKDGTYTNLPPSRPFKTTIPIRLSSAYALIPSLARLNISNEIRKDSPGIRRNSPT